MKKIILLFILIFGITSSNAQISKIEIIATGLTCSMCSNAINKQLKKLTEVEKIETDLNSNTFIIYLKKDNSITPKTIRENIEKAGFFVGSMIFTINFDNQKITDNLQITNGNLDLLFIDSDSKILNGVTKLKVLNKGFVTAKEYKKLVKLYSMYTNYTFENQTNFFVKTL